MSIRIEERGDELVIVSDCHGRPIANVREDGLVLKNKHSSDKCENVVTWDKIEQARREYFARYGLNV